MELLVLVCETLSDIDRVDVHLITRADQDSPRQEDYLKLIEETFRDTNIFFTWELDQCESFHARSIIIDSDWKILLDRGLDIFKPFPYGDFCLERHLQEKRFTKRTEVTFLKIV
jgi:ATP-dependent Lon protease